MQILPSIPEIAKQVEVNKSDILLKVPLDRLVKQGLESPDWSKKPIPVIGSDGVTEVGKHIDFHEKTSDTIDYSVRLTSNGGRLYITETNGSIGNITGEISKNGNGWVKFTNGLIIQWGSLGGAGGRFGISFPISFSSFGSYRVIPTQANADNLVVSLGVVDANRQPTSCELRAGRDAGDLVINWMAIGW